MGLLNAGDVAPADRAFGSYVDWVCVMAQNADAVFRCHQRRQCDFQRGKRLGDDDHIVQWVKPKRCPKHMDTQAFAQLPATVEVREARFQIEQPGFRTQTVIVVTTLLDAKTYPKAKIAELYGLRWTVEVDIKHVKTTLKMEVLSGKTPEMVRKEIYVHLMAYNLLRSVMGQAAQSQAVSALRIAHDFPSDAVVKATPYGIYDMIHNLGYVYVGISADILKPVWRFTFGW